MKTTELFKALKITTIVMAIILNTVYADITVKAVISTQSAYEFSLKDNILIANYSNALTSVMGKRGADKTINTVYPKLVKLLSTKGKTIRLKAVIEELMDITRKQAILNKVNIPGVVTIPTTTSTGTTSVSQTKTLDKTSAIKANEIIDSVANMKIDATNQNDIRTKLQDFGLSEFDAGLMSVKTNENDTFTFCASFTPELYPVESQYEDAQSANAKEFDKLKLRVVYQNDIWFSNQTIISQRTNQYARARQCARLFYERGKAINGGITQAYIKSLFDKIGQTYTIQTKSFYDNGIDAKDIDTWVKSLGNGQLK